MMDKKKARLRRARRARAKMRELNTNRLCVHRTPRHIYAQIISGDGSNVICTASTLDKDLREKNGGNVEAAAESASVLLNVRRKKEFRRLLLTVPVSVITVVSKLWLMRLVKVDLSFKGIR
jgi:ribosomal protein L18